MAASANSQSPCGYLARKFHFRELFRIDHYQRNHHPHVSRLSAAAFHSRLIYALFRRRQMSMTRAKFCPWAPEIIPHHTVGECFCWHAIRNQKRPFQENNLFQKANVALSAARRRCAKCCRCRASCSSGSSIARNSRPRSDINGGPVSRRGYFVVPISAYKVRRRLLSAAIRRNIGLAVDDAQASRRGVRRALIS